MLHFLIKSQLAKSEEVSLGTPHEHGFAQARLKKKAQANEERSSAQVWRDPARGKAVLLERVACFNNMPSKLRLTQKQFGLLAFEARPSWRPHALTLSRPRSPLLKTTTSRPGGKSINCEVSMCLSSGSNRLRT